MAICPSCGKEIRDDIWTCGFCGAPVARRRLWKRRRRRAPYGSEGYNPYSTEAAARPRTAAAREGGVEPGDAGSAPRHKA